MSKYILMVNLNQGRRFMHGDWCPVGTVSARNKREAEQKVKREYYGEDNGVIFTVNINNYTGYKIKAFKDQ